MSKEFKRSRRGRVMETGLTGRGVVGDGQARPQLSKRASRAEILLQKDFAPAKDDHQAAELAPADDPSSKLVRLRETLATGSLAKIPTYIREELLPEALVLSGNSRRLTHRLLQQGGILVEILEEARQPRHDQILTALGIKLTSTYLEFAVMKALRPLPDADVVGVREFDNARTRLYSEAATLRGAKLLGIRAIDLPQDLRRRKGGASALAKVTYDANRTAKKRPAGGLDPKAAGSAGKMCEAEVDDVDDDDGAAAVEVRSDEGPVHGLGERVERGGRKQWAKKATGRLIKVRVPAGFSTELNGEYPALCKIVLRDTEFRVSAAVQLAHDSPIIFHRQCNELLALIDRLPSGPRISTPGPKPLRPRRKGK